MVNPNDRLSSAHKAAGQIHRKEEAKKAQPRISKRDKKDFRRMMGDNLEEEESKKLVQKKKSTERRETKQDKGKPSIFDHASGNVKNKKEEALDEAKSSPFATLAKKDDADPSNFAREQSDLSGFQALQTSHIEAEQASSNVEKRIEIVQQLKKLVTQMVDKLTLLERKGQTDTTITFRHPPLFAGSKVTVTSFKHASKEFNVTFSELSPEAKLLLDAKANQENLQKALEAKGYMMHILVATTEKENLITNPEESYLAREDEQQEKSDQQQESEEEEA